MKNNFIIITMLFLGFSFNSCDDNLEIFPEDSIAVEQGFNNVVDFENALRGVYSAFRRDGYYGASSDWPSVAFIGDVISDNVILNSQGRRSRETYYDWRYDEDDSSETMWLSAYKVIQRSNLILENVDNLDVIPLLKESIRGEALAARAIAHFDLAKFYAASPAQADASSLGIPYVKSTDSSLLPSRNTLGETYDFIIDDLTTAISIMADGNGEGRINANVGRAMLSRIYLFMGENSLALASANEVEGMEVSREDFASVWNDEVSTGVLWKIRVEEVDDISIGVAWFQESPTGIRSEYNADLDLYNLYADNDIRKDVYFETSEFNGIEYNHIIKYRGRLVGNANVVDAKAIRYAEVLLTRAEAQAATGDDGGALISLDALRSNRYANFVSGNETGQALKDAIQLERRLELAFEGQRFFDLKRQGLSINRSTAGDQADGNGIGAEFVTLPAGDFRFNMAIGKGEVDANPNIQQTAGY